MIDQAIILKCLPLQDKKLILTLFSKNLSVEKFVVKPNKNKNLSPLLLIEYSYTPKESGLQTLNHYDILDTFPLIRKEYKDIEIASNLLKTITLANLEGRKEEPVFEGLLFFLKSLPQIPCKETALISFQIKLLQYEGLLPEFFPHLLEEEHTYLLNTLYAKTLKELQTLKIPPCFVEKWTSLFISSLQT